MVLLILSAIFGFIGGGYFGYWCQMRDSMNILTLMTILNSIFFGGYGALMGIMLIVMVEQILDACFSKRIKWTLWTLWGEEELLTISDNSGSSGKLFLGESGFYFLTYAKNESKRIKLYKIPDSEAEIYEYEDVKEKPCVKIWKRRQKASWWNIFSNSLEDLYKLYIPKGSVVKQSKFALK